MSLFSNFLLNRICIAIIFLCLARYLPAQNIIPKPNSIAKGKGICNINGLKVIYTDTTNEAMRMNAMLLQEYLKNESGLQLLVKHSGKLELKDLKAGIALLSKINSNDSNEYILKVLPNSIHIEGSARSVFYGLQTLRQIIFHNNEGNINTYFIKDAPRFQWRGMHLDVSRHFFNVEFVKKYIDILALHKMNVFHWHLTDDQGWRIEIKKYPKLASIASKRDETIVDKNFDPFIGDATPYGGFYTQENIKEVVAYAAQRHITVVPEIEMPGHSVAALSAYPEYSCVGAPLKTLTKWGVSDDVFCSKDSVFNFLFNVLDEVLMLFPSKYIHIGGDEVPKTRWKSCANCQATIKKYKLKDEHELQSYFITKVDSFLTSKGRNTIGWDEILEGGLAPNAAVMSWRGEEGGIEAARQKHKVVMSPGSHCYFDHYQGNKQTEPLAIGGYTTLQKVYSYEPIPKALSKENHRFILGAQANLWTEYIPDGKHALYMMLPRACALSEVLWSSTSQKNYGDFNRRLLSHFKLLKKRGYNYATSIYNISATSQVCEDGLRVSLESGVPSSIIHYTLDGLAPSKKAPIYQKAIPIHKSTLLQAIAINDGMRQGAVLQQEYTLSKSTGASIQLKHPPSKSYNTGGKNTLVDGIVGSLPWSGKEWLGWNSEGLDAIITLKKSEEIKELRISFLQAEESWIHMPEILEVAIADETGLMLTMVTRTYSELLAEWKEHKMIKIPIHKNTGLISIRAVPLSNIPTNKPGAGEAAWLFCSEIIIE